MQDKKITLDDISRGIDKGLDTADGQRAATLARLQSVRQAKATGLRKEQARLTLKYGADHPRVQALAARAESNQGLMRDLAIETTRAQTEIPRVDEVTWILHGYVRDRGGNGLPKLTVALYDSGERTANYVRELGYACTNDKGYFKLAAHNLKDPAAPVFPHVLNGQGTTLHIAAAALTPQAGQLDYREIIIGDESGQCPPPPPAANVQWLVRGHVADATEAALAGVTVSLSDKEQTFAARLGKTQTNPDGNFGLTYRADDFRDLIAQQPDLFLQVSGGVLSQPYPHPTALRFTPGHTDTVRITVKPKSDELKPWIVRGQVSDNAGAALPALTVRIADQANKYADRLGKTKTGAKGKFEFTYKAGDFADLIKQPVDLFLQVLDVHQRVLYTHSQALRFTAGKTETIPIVIGAKKPAAATKKTQAAKRRTK